MKEKRIIIIECKSVYDPVLGNCGKQKDRYGKNEHNYKKLISNFSFNDLLSLP